MYSKYRPEKITFTGFGWQFPGGAESSYSLVVRTIAENPRMSNKQKAELIDQVTYLVGHIISDADFQIRNDYASASYGIEYLKFDIFDRPKKWFCVLFREQAKNIYASACLQSLSRLTSIRIRMTDTAKRIFKDE